MKLITWNCRQNFRKKICSISKFKPDIVVLQECESEEFLNRQIPKNDYETYIWYGENEHKGVGVLSFNNYKLELLDHNPEFKYVLPLKVSKENETLYLFAVWTQLINKDFKISYVVQAVRAFKFYQELLKNDNVLIIGDFNSNSIWDRSLKEYNHKYMVDFLRKYNLVSVYHELHQERQGEETSPTYYHRKNKNNPFHLDYIFIKEDKLKLINHFSIGNYEEYINLSDHMPMFLEL